MAKDASELLGAPQTLARASGKPEAPVTTVLNNLTITEGRKLDILTRTNPALANAAQIGLIFRRMFGSEYVADRVQLIECLSISMDGKGREEQISALQAGGTLPDSYFDKKSSGEYSEAR